MIISGVTLSGVGYVVDTTPVTNGLQLYLDSRNPTSWPGSGTTWYDLSGNGKNATFYYDSFSPVTGENNPTGTVVDGTALNSSSMIKNGYNDLRFDGSTGSAVYQYAAGSNLGTNITQWTINTWFYANSWQTGGYLPAIFTGVYAGGGGSISTVNFCLTSYNGSTASDTNIRAGYYSVATGWQLSGGYALTTGTWYNIVGTYDGANIKLYINNVLQNTTASAGGGSNLVSTLGYRVARRWDGYDSFDAYIPVAMLYNRALTANEISQNFNYFRTRYGA